LVGRDVWGELEVCESEPEGARSVFRRDPGRRQFVEVDDQAVRHDVDQIADLEALS
jgi:CTP:molybdopterin cytidylyltransferase MocA